MTAEHAQRFVADQRHRARHRMPSLGLTLRGGRPGVVNEYTIRPVFNAARRLLLDALACGQAERIGLSREFITAFPSGGPRVERSRNPFTDEVARALADEANLRVLAEQYDPHDRGLRDVWEALVLTGRRCREVLDLRLDCFGRYGGLPMLWHDQTKVGNLNAGIRIPERLHHRLDERRRKTLDRFERRYGRVPTSAERTAMALFPRSTRNPNEDQSISYEFFHRAFRKWVHWLETGPCVPHQARHTLATKLLAHGATLAHIRKYLGHISDRMAEHYIEVSNTELDDILHTVWVAGPGAANPGEVLSGGTPLTREEAVALAVDLGRRSTPADGGFCTYQPVVDGGDCPWKLDCENCDKFVLSGADLLYWRRKREQWHSIAERAPDDATADYLHRVFEPTARAIDGLEKALAALGLLDQALAMDLRRPQDYFHRIWNTGFRAADLTQVAHGPAQTT